MKVIIESNYLALVNIDNKQILLNENEEIILEDCKLLMPVIVYPIINYGTYLIPFAFLIDSKFENDNVEQIMIKDNLYITLTSPKICERVYSQTLNVSNKKYKVKVSQNNISFSGEKTGANLKLSNEFSNFKTGTESNYIYVNLNGQDKHLILYNTLTNEIYTFSGDNFTIKNKTLTFLFKNKDLAKHAQLLSFSLDQEKPSLKNSELYYENNIPKITQINKLKPIAFIEAIKLEDYDLAKTYLSKELNLALKKEHLKEFFPKFENYKILENDNDHYKIALIFDKKYKIYDFKIDDKIIEITEE